MRTTASHRDKSADLFALTARSRNCLSSCCEPDSAERLPQVQKQKTVEITSGRIGRTVRGLQSDASYTVPWRKSESAQACHGAADCAANEFRKSTFQESQVQPNEQPSAEDFGGEAA